MSKTEKLVVPDSSLGTDPICDVCRNPVRVGEEVIQTMRGTVAEYPEQGELGIVEISYTVIHVRCRIWK